MPFYSYPRIPGHELGVEVLAVGDQVKNIRAGDRCSVEPYLNCGRCHACRRGATNCCESLEVLGVMTDGGLRERFLVPARKLHPSSNLAFEQLALIETLAIGCHAVSRGAPEPGDSVLVIGAGPIGLATIEFVKLSGARIIVLDLNARRLEFCKRMMRVDDVILVDGQELESIQKATNGGLAQVVFDATGDCRSMGRALQFCSFTGRVVYVGLTRQDVAITHGLLMHRRELTLLASRNAVAGDFRHIIQLIEEGRIDTRPWITHRAGFDTMIQDFPGWATPESGVVKAMVSVV
jgi:alcohol dehydrogenase